MKPNKNGFFNFFEKTIDSPLRGYRINIDGGGKNV